jgi:hypothetical protein
VIESRDPEELEFQERGPWWDKPEMPDLPPDPPIDVGGAVDEDPYALPPQEPAPTTAAPPAVQPGIGTVGKTSERRRKGRKGEEAEARKRADDFWKKVDGDLRDSREESREALAEQAAQRGGTVVLRDPASDPAAYAPIVFTKKIKWCTRYGFKLTKLFAAMFMLLRRSSPPDHSEAAWFYWPWTLPGADRFTLCWLTTKDWMTELESEIDNASREIAKRAGGPHAPLTVFTRSLVRRARTEVAYLRARSR